MLYHRWHNLCLFQTAYWDGLPSFTFGVASLIAGLATFLVPDIANDALPDTVKEAEALGMKDKAIPIHNISRENEMNKSGIKNRSFDWKE